MDKFSASAHSSNTSTELPSSSIDSFNEQSAYNKAYNLRIQQKFADSKHFTREAFDERWRKNVGTFNEDSYNKLVDKCKYYTYAYTFRYLNIYFLCVKTL